MADAPDRDRELREVPLRQIDPSTWPKGVRQISLEELGSFGVANDGLLHWNGQPVVTRRKFEVRGVELWLLVTAAAGTLLQGIAAMFPFVPKAISALFGFST